MTRDELHDMIDWLDAQTNNAAARTADFLRQIAESQPVVWAWGYADIAAPCLSFNDPAELRDPDIGSVVALYTLPLED